MIPDNNENTTQNDEHPTSPSVTIPEENIILRPTFPDNVITIENYDIERDLEDL
ncbi:hypothetical protein [Providencia sp. PROV193]|uniref:hypothetical protein n=1 Tax=Providencia sp. PROV193 TaxID=2949894 RepID=UPI002349C163|nr:hypothetical protein [Providencia sp. PROV193]